MDRTIYAMSNYSFWVLYNNVGNISVSSPSWSGLPLDLSWMSKRLGVRLRPDNVVLELHQSARTESPDTTALGHRTSSYNSSAWRQSSEDRHSFLFQEQTHHHKEVFVYDGDPDSVVLEGSSQTAFLLTAYADAENGVHLFLVIDIHFIQRITWDRKFSEYLEWQPNHFCSKATLITCYTSDGPSSLSIHRWCPA